jgi:hypothetical protein
MRSLPLRAFAFSLVFWAAAAGLADTAAHKDPSPVELVRKTVNCEIDASKSSGRFMFRQRKLTAKGSETKLIIETRDAMAGLLIAIDDHPLTPEQRRAEDDRVDRFAKDPEELRKRQKQEKDDEERIGRIMRALPEAFIYEYDGTEPATKGVGRMGETLARLRFHPNPNYDPPTHVEQVLVGMAGYLLIDEQRHRIARIDGTLDRDVGFGWGILGHLDRGGHFLVEQGDVGQSDWEITHMDLAFTGKVLFFKSINIKSSEYESDFRPVPPTLSFAQGIELLRKNAAEVAEK